MAGHGPPPKDPGSRARRNKAPEFRVIEAVPCPQPPLPTFEVEDDGGLVEFRWPARTVEWWAMWGESPMAPEFTANDWSELMDTALLHAQFWRGATKLASELRLRVALFGATPADRARLKITFAHANEATTRGSQPASPSRYSGLRLAD